MTLENALRNISVLASPDARLVEIVINYSTEWEMEGSASLKTNRFFKDRIGTLDTLRRAWKYACATNPEREMAVTSVEVIPPVAIPGEKKSNKKSA